MSHHDIAALNAHRIITHTVAITYYVRDVRCLGSKNWGPIGKRENE